MRILDFLKFSPKVEKRLKSDFNGEIAVVNYGKERNIVVGNLIQSGPFIERLWFGALRPLSKKQVKQVLVLGLGAGSVITSLRSFWPNCQITGVEKDKAIVKAGQRYFGLDIENVNVKIADAFQFVRKAKSNFYDLVIVDLYVGEKIPDAVKSKPFLLNLKKIVKKNGVVVFNHLYFAGHKKAANLFKNDLSPLFPNLVAKKNFPFMATNLLIYCQK